MIKDKKILITGGAGFIGSHLVDSLISENEIIVFDDFSRGSIENLSHLKDNANLKIFNGNILDANKLTEAMQDVNIAFHLAGVTGIDTVFNNPLKTLKINIFGTHNVLEAARKNNVERVLYASTSEVYGPWVHNAHEDEKTTQGTVKESRWSYSTSKLAAEHLLQGYFKEYGMLTTIVRYFNIYGPRQKGESAIHNFIENALKNQPLQIYGEGTQIRAWCFISDAVEGTLFAAEKQEGIGEVFNIGNPMTALTISALAQMIIDMINPSVKIEFVELNRADVIHRVPSIEKAQTLLHLRPKVSLYEGLKLTIEWYRAALNF